MERKDLQQLAPSLLRTEQPGPPSLRGRLADCGSRALRLRYPHSQAWRLRRLRSLSPQAASCFWHDAVPQTPRGPIVGRDEAEARPRKYNPLVVGEILLVGLALGWVRWRTRSTISTILLHTFLNAAGMAETYFQLRG